MFYHDDAVTDADDAIYPTTLFVGFFRAPN
jgi:hypothetical protein